MMNGLPSLSTPALLSLCVLLAAAALQWGCGDDEPQELPYYEFSLEVEASDLDGNSVAGIPVLLDDQVVGFTDADGVFEAILLEQPTQVIHLAVDEIEGYRIADEEPSIEKTLQIAPRLDGDGHRGIPVSLRVDFRSTFMDYLTWVQIECDDDLDDENCEDVPVLLDDEELVRTDNNGFAHFSFQGLPGDDHTLRLEMPEHDPDDDDSVKIEPEDTVYDIELSPDATVFYIAEEFTDPDAPQTPTWRPPPSSSPSSSSSDGSSGSSGTESIFD